MVYGYDDNGNRTNKTVTIGGTPTETSYVYDEDNRLTNVVLNGTATTHKFEYDYRSRRFYRSVPGVDHMYSVFDGGLAVQEYKPNWKTMPQPGGCLETEFIRGEGMGGGVGGMVYSIKDGTNTYSHSNHRGDVISRSDDTRKKGSARSLGHYFF